MARDVVDIRISLKKRGGKTYRIGLVRTLAGRRYKVLRDGRRSRKIPEATATEIAQALRKWLVAQLHTSPWDWLPTDLDSR